MIPIASSLLHRPFLLKQGKGPVITVDVTTYKSVTVSALYPLPIAAQSVKYGGHHGIKQEIIIGVIARSVL